MMSSSSVVAIAALLVVACSKDPVGEAKIRTDPVVEMDLPIVAVAASGGHTCAVSKTGNTYCWGANTYGELGDGTSTPSGVPVLVLAPAPLLRISTNGFVRWPEYGIVAFPWAAYSCGLDGQGTAYCWGDRTSGQLGIGPIPCVECSLLVSTPQTVPGGPYTQLSAGDRHACALTPGGSAFCWGTRSGIEGAFYYPSEVRGLPEPIVAVSAGGDHTCMLGSSGRVFCWGSNRWGQIGTGLVGLHERQVEPIAVPGLAFASLTAGDNSTCAVTAAGKAYCWGRNDTGQLGNGEVWPVCRTNAISLNTEGCDTDPHGPQPVAGSIMFTSLVVGQFHTCGLDQSGRAYCWGAQDKIGRSSGDATQPGLVETDRRFMAIAAGARHTCAIATDGMVYCWGEGRFGQLGLGNDRTSLLPTAVLGQR